MQTELERAVKLGIETADALQRRAKSVLKLAEFTKAPMLSVALDPQQIFSTAELIRTYAATLICMDSTIALRVQQVRELDAALADAIALGKTLRSASLEELTAFWHRMQEQKQ